MWPALLGEGWGGMMYSKMCTQCMVSLWQFWTVYPRKLRRRDPRWWLNVERASPQFFMPEACHLWVKHQTGSQGDKWLPYILPVAPLTCGDWIQRANLHENTMWDQKLGLQPQVWPNPGLFWVLSPVIWFFPEHPWDSAGWPHQSVPRNVIQTWTQLLMVESLL